MKALKFFYHVFILLGFICFLVFAVSLILAQENNYSLPYVLSFMFLAYLMIGVAETIDEGKFPLLCEIGEIDFTDLIKQVSPEWRRGIFSRTNNQLELF